MAEIKRITVPVEFTIQDGVIFLMEGSGSWSDPDIDGGVNHGFGVAGAKFVAYLPNGKAITLQALDMINIGLKAIKAETFTLARDLTAGYLAMDSTDSDGGYSSDDVIAPAGSTVTLVSRDNDMLEVTGFANSPDTVAYIHKSDIR